MHVCAYMCVYVYACVRVCVCVFKYRPQLPRWLSSKDSACQYERCRLDPWVRKSPWSRQWQLQYSGLENLMDRVCWRSIAHGVAKELDMTEPLNNMDH